MSDAKEKAHHVFDTPIQNHPSVGKTVNGKIVFPENFMASDYAVYMQEIKRQDEDEENDQFRTEAYYRVAKALSVEIEVDGKPLPRNAALCSFGLLMWLRAGVLHYLSPFLTVNYSPKQPTNRR